MKLSEIVEKEKRSSEKRLKGRERTAYGSFDDLGYLYME
jgi:hypothetical protein